ncbi:PRC-barrel domain-containing protein [Hyphococcus luteus]|nr:PRC-barrel domain-containing protein [Marinicaulis flavus]
MNKLLLSTAAFALLTPMAASAGEKPKTDAAKTETQAEMKANADMNAYDKDKHDKDKAKKDKTAGAEMTNDAAVIYMPAASLSAKELLGEGIEGANGERIARIDDIVIDKNGRAEDVVFLSGGIFGLGGKRGALDYRAVDIDVNRDYEPDVHASLNEEGIKAVAEFKTDKMNDYSLASELLGAELELTPGGEGATDVVINDIIFDADGDVEYLLVQKTAIGPIGAGDKYAVAYNKLTVAQGDGGLVLDMSEDELNAAPIFAMKRSGVEKAWDKTRQGVKDAAEKTGDAIEDAVD